MAMASEIKEHMEVVDCDGEHVGTVDRIEGEQIKLTKSDPASGGEHHFIDLDTVDAVDSGKVCLRSTVDEVRASWS
jgi:hypothetical protein